MRTLGVCLAPDGNDQDKYKHRMEEATLIRETEDDPTQEATGESMLPSDSVLSGR
jgi:hypothetical protein